MKRLYHFLEKLDPECNNTGKIDVRGCKIDGEKGLKTYLGLNVSSCDYFYFKKKNNTNIVTFIEFTDLHKQKENLKTTRKLYILNAESLIDNSSNEESIEKFKTELKSKLKALKTDEIKRIILDEFRKKTLESIVIFYNLGNNKFTIKAEKYKNLEFSLRVIICQPTDAIFIENLERDLKNTFNNIIKDIKIVPVCRSQYIVNTLI